MFTATPHGIQVRKITRLPLRNDSRALTEVARQRNETPAEQFSRYACISLTDSYSFTALIGSLLSLPGWGKQSELLSHEKDL